MGLHGQGDVHPWPCRDPGATEPPNRKDEISLFITELKVNFGSMKYDFNK